MLRPGSALRGNASISAVTGRPPGTASRLATGMARPGSRSGMAGAGVGLTAQLRVEDRPMTQQGLGGMKSSGKGPQRVVQDRTYYMGLIRTKTGELWQEIQKLRKDTAELQEEQSTYLTYEKRAEKLATEIQESQAQLADYNMLVDKANVNEDIQDIERDYKELLAKNDQEAKNMESLFSRKHEKERQIQELQVELEQEKRMAENLVADMKPEMRERYYKSQDQNNHLLTQLESLQREIDSLNIRRVDLEDELSMSQVKQEAVRLYVSLNELTAKRDGLMAEMQEQGSPQEQRERLLGQVKQDNQEIASMERHIAELREKLEQIREEIASLDQDIEECQGERNQKYQELKKRDQQMTDFLATFDQVYAEEMAKITQLQENIIALLEHMSRNMARFSHLPTPQELATMRDDLQFKEHEMKKSESTAASLSTESQKLQMDLQKVENLESKINTELEALNTRIRTMQDELLIYSDLDKLKQDAADKKQRLSDQKVSLQDKREIFRKQVAQLSDEYEALRKELNENETHTTLTNLERKWQHYEQNNFVMKEFIASKKNETDYEPVRSRVNQVLSAYNESLLNR